MDEGYSAVDQGKVYFLESTIVKKPKQRGKRFRNFARRRLRKTDLMDLTYESFLPIYQMWCKYYSQLNRSSSSRLDENIMKADYHGCLFLVGDAASTSQIGICGIVVQETKETFRLITKQNKIRTIPKQNSVLQFALEGKIFTLFGNAFRFNASQRLKKTKGLRSLPFLP